MSNPNPYDFRKWKNLIPDIETIIEKIENTPIVSVGITPYTRIVPSFFLRNYSIYTINRSSDVDIMETFSRMHILEDYYPKIAKKVHSTGYLIGNHIFQSFLKSRRPYPKLMFYTMTDKITQDLNRLNIPWIGNDPKTFEEVKFKGTFRELVKRLELPSLSSKTYNRETFLIQNFESLWKENDGAFVIQRADKETGGNEGTFFIHQEDDFKKCFSILEAEKDFEQAIITPFINGQSTSMLGCVLPNGILSGPLQLQLIDVPESLNGIPANGIFFGNDLAFRSWNDDTEIEAQKVVESIGNNLREKGYRGIFGIDFLYDQKRNKIFPNECNPRFTGSLLLYSLMLLEAGTPPLEFFHLIAHLNIPANFDFNLVNNALKKRIPCAHIAFSPKGITSMKLPLLAGVYSYDSQNKSLSYKGAGISLHDLKNENDFLLIDTVPKINEPIEQSVPRLFKFVFKRSIAKSSYAIDEEASFLVSHFAKALLKAVKENAPNLN